jgi:aspartyl protease family protein
MSDTVAQALIYALILILPISALAARRLPMRTTVKYVIAWVAIFAVGTAILASFT